MYAAVDTPYCCNDAPTDIGVAKFDAAGNRTWKWGHGDSGKDVGTVAVDADGDAYSHLDDKLVKLAASDRAVLWSKTFSATPAGSPSTPGSTRRRFLRRSSSSSPRPATSAPRRRATVPCGQPPEASPATGLT